MACHVINRGNGRDRVFHDEGDYEAFVELLAQSMGKTPMRVLGCCLMPNHFHLLVRPPARGDLSRWMQWLMTSQVRRHHRRYGSSGHVWQGRFKSFRVERRRPSPAERARGVVEVGNPLWSVLRYVERNPLRAGLVTRAESWPWSSAHARLNPSDDDSIALTDPPGGPPADWTDCVNRMLGEWGLQSALRRRGRPRKRDKGSRPLNARPCETRFPISDWEKT